jgi:hypothetical protein
LRLFRNQGRRPNDLTVIETGNWLPTTDNRLNCAIVLLDVICRGSCREAEEII